MTRPDAKTRPPPGRPSRPEEKRRRLAAALKRNLQRRKQAGRNARQA